MKRVASKMWRDSASLIVLARTVPKSEFNYDILVFKRSEKTSFMKNSIVFPGGQVDKTDDSKDWITLYKSLGITENKLKELSNVKGPREILFKKNETEELERDISLRITAIRETFEELGVLICKNQKQFQNNDIFTNFTKDFDIIHWQKVVHNDPSQFLVLCKKLKVAPDLWNCFEWSAWLTPSILFPRRFAVAFYVVALEEKPEIFPEEHEVQDYQWANIHELNLLQNNKQIWLPPPQQYELLRMMQIKKIDNLISFAKERNNLGTTIYFPIQYQTKDKFVQILPGDDFYPKNVDYTFANNYDKFSDKTAEEIRKNVKHLHRTEYYSLHDFELYMNIKTSNSHLQPMKTLLNNKL